MSHFLDRLTFFRKTVDTFADGHGIVTNEDRGWEDAYRARWQHDKIVRSTHGVNCTGSCSWQIYVKGGIITWETQQTDYPRTRPDLPNHEPRGCSRGASYSWYIYSANRLKYPLVRSRLVRHWREARRTMAPVAAWASIVEDEAKRRDYQRVRGLGGFVRSDWEEVNEIVAAANVYTIRTHGPDRVIGFSPIPAMSMVSYAAGSRYLSLIGGVCMSFYDWYCDLPPSSPQTWGEQTDVPESADWYNSTFLMMWGSNVPQTRTPDAHFMTEVRYKGATVVTVTPDYSEASKFADIWLNPKQGTDAALALAMGHVILKEWHLAGRSPYFEDYCRRYTDMPFLVRLRPVEGGYVPDRMLRAADMPDALGQANNPEWKTVAIDEAQDDAPVCPVGSIGFRWGESGKWNIEERDGGDGSETRLRLSLIHVRDEAAPVAFPYFGNAKHDHFTGTDHDDVLWRNVPVKKVATADGEVPVATVYDLFVANYGLDRGLGGGNVATTYDDDVPYTPAWQERITGVGRDKVVAVARQFADNAHKTEGRSMVIVGAALNHWYHMDMIYRSIINMLVMCGCVGKSGGGWSHYVGQEKLRPQTGWLPLAFALDWNRPPRQMNSTSFWYNHTDQWRYEKLAVDEIISPLAPEGDWETLSLIDFNVRSERMGWLPSAPQLATNPLEVTRAPGEDDPVAGGGRRAAGRLAADVLRGSRRSEELAAQPVRLALQPARLERQGPRIFPEAPARHPARRAGQGARRDRRGQEAGRGRLARRGAGRQARPAGHARLPHVHHLPLFRHRAADGDLVREERSQHLRHAPLHPPALGGGRPGVGVPQRLGDLQGHRKEVLGGRGRRARRRSATSCWCRRCTTPRRNWPRPAMSRTGRRASAIPSRATTMPNMVGGRTRLSEHLQEVHGPRSADDEGGQRRQGNHLEHR